MDRDFKSVADIAIKNTRKTTSWSLNMRSTKNQNCNNVRKKLAINIIAFSSWALQFQSIQEGL
jgi:hypothetical protein